MFSKHAHGCTPLKPCNACRTAAFLKEKLKPSDFEEMVRIFNGNSATVPVPTPATLEIRLETLGLSLRTANALSNGRKVIVGDLKGVSRAELLRMVNFGRAQLNELTRTLGGYGLTLSEGLLAAD